MKFAQSKIDMKSLLWIIIYNV